MNPKVDFFFNKAGMWQESYKQLRMIALSTGLTEELKWGCPCYTYQKTNVFLIHGFKDYCALLFMKGVLMKDPKGILIQQTENVQSARQIRFTSNEQIIEMEPMIKSYMLAAVDVEESGLKVELKKTSDYQVPQEFKQKLERIPELKLAFEALTPGRQRAYLYFFSQPKQSKTREARIENSIESILNGKGLND